MPRSRFTLAQEFPPDAMHIVQAGMEKKDMLAEA